MLPFKFQPLYPYLEWMLNDTGTFNAGVLVMDLDILRWGGARSDRTG